MKKYAKNAKQGLKNRGITKKYAKKLNKPLKK